MVDLIEIKKNEKGHDYRTEESQNEKMNLASAESTGNKMSIHTVKSMGHKDNNEENGDLELEKDPNNERNKKKNKSRIGGLEKDNNNGQSKIVEQNNDDQVKDAEIKIEANMKEKRNEIKENSSKDRIKKQRKIKEEFEEKKGRKKSEGRRNIDIFEGQKKNWKQIIVYYNGCNFTINLSNLSSLQRLVEYVKDFLRIKGKFMLSHGNRPLRKDEELQGLKHGSTVQIIHGLKGGSDLNAEELDERISERRKPINELTTIRRKLMDLNLSEMEYNAYQQRYESTFSEIQEELYVLSSAARKLKKKESIILLENEIEKLDNQNEKINAIIYERSQKENKVNANTVRTEEKLIKEKLTLPKLQKLILPKFGGVVMEYERWRRTFDTCVGKTSIPEIYKQLQLDQCLYGEPKRLIENFDLSENGYKAALEKLDTYYGGEQRCYAALMTEVMRFRHIKEDDVIGLDEFVSLIDGVIVRLQNLGRKEELGGGLLYQILLEKLPESIILMWERRVVEKKLNRTVEELKDWIEIEAMVRRNTIERVRGINIFNPSKDYSLTTENRHNYDQVMNKNNPNIEKCSNFSYKNLSKIKNYENMKGPQKTFFTDKKNSSKQDKEFGQDREPKTRKINKRKGQSMLGIRKEWRL